MTEWYNIVIQYLVKTKSRKVDMLRDIVSVAGDASIEKGGKKERLAFELGKALIDAGYRVQTGGLGGVMEAVCRGAKSSEKYRDGDIIALVPSFDATQVNEYADIVIPTGLDVMRNAMVANACAVIALGGGAGTLTEMGFAWTFRRLLIAYENVEGWSAKLAGTKLDDRMRYPDIPEDKVYGVSNASEAVTYLDKYIKKYTTRHKGIVYQDGREK